jgi:hypothetical protein
VTGVSGEVPVEMIASVHDEEGGLLSRCLLEGCDLIGSLPGKFGELSAKMSIVAGLAINRS